MREVIRDRASGWGARLSFAALLLLASELLVWQTPTAFNVLEWAGLAAVYLALAALALDLIARFHVNEVFSVLLIAGMYGLVNATLISHITTRDLPISLVVRPLAAQPLAFLAALAAFQILASGRATGPLDFGAALGIGLVWGVWVRWFPITSDEAIPVVGIDTALIALGLGMLGALVLRYVVPPAAIFRDEDWRLVPGEWIFVAAALGGALALGMADEDITPVGVVLVATLISFMVGMLIMTGPLRRAPVILRRITPPRRPNPAAWVVLIVPLLVAGWIGFKLPGSGDSSLQSDILIGALTGYGLFWLPVVSIGVGVRAFIQLAREEG